MQEDTLNGKDSSVDIATKENLEKLVHIGERLLKKPVSRVNLETGLSESITKETTNADALKRYSDMSIHDNRLIGLLSILHLLVC